ARTAPRGGPQAGDALRREATFGGHAAEGDADADQQRPRHGLEGLGQERSGGGSRSEPDRDQQQGQLQQEPEQDGQPGDTQQRRPRTGWRRCFGPSTGVPDHQRWAPQRPYRPPPRSRPMMTPLSMTSSRRTSVPRSM